MPMEKAWKRTARKQLNGTANLQNKAMQWHNVILAIAMAMEKAWKRTARKQLNGTVRRQKMEMQLRKTILGCVTNMVQV